MEIQPDPDLDIERAEKLYDSLKAGKGRVPTQQEDIKFLVRAAVNVKVDPFKEETTRRKQLVELEELTRDLATQLQALAQKTDDRKVYLQAASAYKEYLSLFRPEKYVRDIMHNRADALFAAHEYPSRRGSSRSSRPTSSGRRTPPAPRPPPTAPCSLTSARSSRARWTGSPPSRSRTRGRP
jgi:hypothetical protein